METITEAERKVDLFAEDLPAMEEINELSQLVHSSKSDQLAFAEQVEANLPKTGRKAAPAAGIGLFILGRYAESIETLNKAMDCKEKFTYLAFALCETGRWEEAIENFQKSLDHGADILTVTLEKAATYRHASDFEAAEKELKSCANLENVSAGYHYQCGRLQEALGLYEEAMESYKTALDLSPNHRKTLFHLAYRYDLSGNEEAAIDYYKQIAKTKPIYVSALMNLAVKNFGETSLREIKNILESKSLHLGMGLEESHVVSTEAAEYPEAAADEVLDEILNKSVDDLQLSVRARKCLQKLNMYTLRDLTQKTEAELLGCKNFGVTSLNEIKKAISNLGLSLRSID
jgi:tetratricopeptide (TPR) repeat protein